MAISENLLLQMLSGKIGRSMVIKKYGDKTVVSKRPNMQNRKLSPKQIAINQHVTKANEQALDILADPELSAAAQVRLNVTRNKLYTALIKDYFKQLKASA